MPVLDGLGSSGPRPVRSSSAGVRRSTMVDRPMDRNTSTSVVGELMERVAAKQPPPPGDPAVRRGYPPRSRKLKAPSSGTRRWRGSMPTSWPTVPGRPTWPSLIVARRPRTRGGPGTGPSATNVRSAGNGRSNGCRSQSTRMYRPAMLLVGRHRQPTGRWHQPPRSTMRSPLK